VLGLGVLAWRRYQRSKPHYCPNCKTRMVRLDEEADNSHLDAGQKVEEMLGSVDYDVWKCPGCQTRSVSNYPNMFSQMGTCPQCNYRTQRRVSTIINHATKYSAGLRHITGDCQNCNHHRRSAVKPLALAMGR